jgi:NADH-quinone oxidoreductase B subunit
MMAKVSARYDIARFGAEAFRASPRQADMLILSGRVSIKMAPVIRRIYDQMLEPKWVIAMGACSSSGGVFSNYAVVQGADKFMPVDIHVPGCPPRPEALMFGFIRLQEKIMTMAKGGPDAEKLREFDRIQQQMRDNVAKMAAAWEEQRRQNLHAAASRLGIPVAELEAHEQKAPLAGAPPTPIQEAPAKP